MTAHTLTRLSVTALLLFLSALVIACGGGSAATGPAAPMGVTTFSPGMVIPSETDQPFLIVGWGFGPVGDPCPIRLTATTGTPFAMGTSATLDGYGQVQTGESIRGVMDPARIPPGSGPVSATIELLLPDGSTFEIPGELAVFAELEYSLRVFEVDPAFGETYGGELVTVRGSGFMQYGPGLPRVFFNGLEASNVVVQSDIALTCITPAYETAIVDVTVINDYDTTILAAGFEYQWNWGWDWDYGPVFVDNVTHPYVEYRLPPGFTFPWYGRTTDSVYLANYGLEPRFGGSWLGWLSIAGDCIDTQPAGSAIHVKQLPDRVVITYDHVKYAHGAGYVTAQVILHESGAFAMMWQEHSYDYSWIAMYPDNYTSTTEVDWTTEPSSHGSQYVSENFGSTRPFDLVGYGLQFEPNNQGGYDTTLYPLDP